MKKASTTKNHVNPVTRRSTSRTARRSTWCTAAEAARSTARSITVECALHGVAEQPDQCQGNSREERPQRHKRNNRT